MAIRIKVQKNYYLSEVTMELPTDLGALDDLLKATKASGRIVSLYNQGGVLGVNVEQRTKIPEAVDDEVRRLLGIDSKIL
jgi:hypothetical protein